MTAQMSSLDKLFLNAGISFPYCAPPSAMVHYIIWYHAMKVRTEDLSRSTSAYTQRFREAQIGDGKHRSRHTEVGFDHCRHAERFSASRWGLQPLGSRAPRIRNRHALSDRDHPQCKKVGGCVPRSRKTGRVPRA